MFKRFAFIFASIALFGSLASWLLGLFIYENTVVAQSQERSLSLARFFAASIRNSSQTPTDANLRALAWQQEFQLSFIGLDGIVIADNYPRSAIFNASAPPKELEDALAYGEGVSVRWSALTAQKTVFAAVQAFNSANRLIGIARVGQKIVDSKPFLRQLSLALIIPLGLLAALCAGAAFALARSAARSVAAIQQATNAYALGDLAHPAPVFASTEFKAIAAGLEHMRNKLKERFNALTQQEKARKEFIANVSHELKTPITALQTYLSLMQTQGCQAKEVDAYLPAAQKETARFAAIIDGLLIISRLDEEELFKEEFLALDLLASAQAALSAQARQKSISIALECSSKIIIYAHPQLAEEALINLLSNALKYCPAGSAVVLRGWQDEAGCFLSVEDNGPGIAQEEKERIFERFYRGRSQKRSDGAGLGLAIANRIMLAHQGSLSLESAAGQGARFRLFFPKKILKRFLLDQS